MASAVLFCMVHLSWMCESDTMAIDKFHCKCWWYVLLLIPSHIYLSHMLISLNLLISSSPHLISFISLSYSSHHHVLSCSCYVRDVIFGSIQHTWQFEMACPITTTTTREWSWSLLLKQSQHQRSTPHNRMRTTTTTNTTRKRTMRRRNTDEHEHDKYVHPRCAVYAKITKTKMFRCGKFLGYGYGTREYSMDSPCKTADDCVVCLGFSYTSHKICTRWWGT